LPATHSIAYSTSFVLRPFIIFYLIFSEFKERIKVCSCFVESVDIKIDAVLYSVREERAVFAPILFMTGGKAEVANRHKNLIILYCTILL
jgi:hypothetical protein